MTNFEGTQLTQKGLALLAKSGIVLNFTKAETGAGTYAAGEDVKKLTALKQKKQSFGLTNVSKKTDTQVAVKFVISNKTLTAGYLFTEIGLYAKDPDEGEILYAVCYSTPENATEIQKYNGIFEASIIMSLNVEVSNDGKISIVPSGLYALQEDMISAQDRLNVLDSEMDEVNSNIATNLLKPTLATTTSKEVTLTNNGDGTYTLNGTATGLTYFQFYPKFSVDTGIYTLSGHSSIEDDVYLWCDEKTKAYKGSFELLSSDRYYLTIKVNSGQVYDNVVVKPMLEVGTVAHDFVPYTGDSGRLNEDVASKMPKSAMSNSKVITTKGESVADAYELNEANSDSYAKAVQDQFDTVNDSLANGLKMVFNEIAKNSDFTMGGNFFEHTGHAGVYLVMSVPNSAIYKATFAIVYFRAWYPGYNGIYVLGQGNPTISIDGMHIKISNSPDTCDNRIYAFL